MLGLVNNVVYENGVCIDSLLIFVGIFVMFVYYLNVIVWIGLYCFNFEEFVVFVEEFGLYEFVIEDVVFVY